MDLNDTVNKKTVAGKKASTPLPKPFMLAPPEGDKSPNFYNLAVAARLVKPGEARAFARRKEFDKALAESIFDEEAFIALVELHRKNGWDPLTFVQKRLEILFGTDYLSNGECCKRILPVYNFWRENGIDFTYFFEERIKRLDQEIEESFKKLRSSFRGEVYSNLVLAIPHAVGNLAFSVIETFKLVEKAIDIETEWYTNEFFPLRHKLIKSVKCPYSQLEVDVECSEDDPARIASFRLPDKGNYQGEIPDEFLRKYCYAWSQYHRDIIAAASRGSKPLVIDCRAFSSSLASDVDICLGFNDDDSKPSDDTLSDLEFIFGEAGYRVKRNEPYTESIVPAGYQGHSLMIAVNKAVYLNRDTRDKRRGYYKTLKETIRDVYKYLLNNPLL